MSYAESDKLLSVSTNKSLFDKANRIVLIGDRVTHTVERPTKGETREVRVVDSTIKTRTEAETRANELLSLHSDDLRKITINVQKEGLELIEAGDISTSLFKRNSVEISGGTFLFDEMGINVVGVSYEIVGSSNLLSYNSNMGFDDLVGFTEEVGFEHSTVTKKSYGSKFFEQEAYGGLSQ
jgi:hypothetical protein